MNAGVKKVGFSAPLTSGGVENFSQWPNAVFKIPDMLQWLVIFTESRVIEEIRKAPEGVLSLMASLDEVSYLSLSFDQ